MNAWVGYSSENVRQKSLSRLELEIKIRDNTFIFSLLTLYAYSNSTQVERYDDVRSVLLCAEIRAVISLKWRVIRPHYVTIRSSYTVTFWHTAVENRIATVHGRKTIYFNGSTARISAHNSTERMRTISLRSFFLENVLYYPLTNEIVNGPMSLSHQDKRKKKIRHSGAFD